MLAIQTLPSKGASSILQEASPQIQLNPKEEHMVAAIQALPQTGHLEVNIRVSAQVNVSAFVARQKADSFILSQISYMMHAGEPELVLNNRILWRVPVVLSQRSRGNVGQVGAVDVDVETGQLAVTPLQIEEMQERADGTAILHAFVTVK